MRKLELPYFLEAPLVGNQNSPEASNLAFFRPTLLTEGWLCEKSDVLGTIFMVAVRAISP